MSKPTRVAEICRLVLFFAHVDTSKISAYSQATEWRSLTNQLEPQGKGRQFCGCLTVAPIFMDKLREIGSYLLEIHDRFFPFQQKQHVSWSLINSWIPIETSDETKSRRPSLVPRPKLCKPNKMIDWIDRLLVVAAPEPTSVPMSVVVV